VNKDSWMNTWIEVEFEMCGELTLERKIVKNVIKKSD